MIGRKPGSLAVRAARRRSRSKPRPLAPSSDSSPTAYNRRITNAAR